MASNDYENIKSIDIANTDEDVEEANSDSDCFASIRGHVSSIGSQRHSIQSLSSSIPTIIGCQGEDGNVYCEIFEAGVKDDTYHFPCGINRTEVDISKEKFAKQCLKCGKEKASHYCQSCKEGRQYMCYICLNDHNYWFDDHDVVTLSVECERNQILQKENLNKIETNDGENFLLKNMSSESRQSLKTLKQSDQATRKSFFKDTLYRDIAYERRGKQRKTSEGKLKKYGTYEVRTRSDTKTCAIIGIVQIENKKLVLADSENSELKIMDQESLRIIVSHALPSNPYTMCFYEENKVIIAFINNEFHLVDLTDGLYFQKLFEIKTLFKSIDCADIGLIGCMSDTIEVYSYDGDQISKFKLEGVTDIEDMCVSKERDIIFCADEKKGIVVLDIDGTIIDIISNNLCQPHRMCLGHQRYIYVTENNSERIMKVDLHRMNAYQIEREELYKHTSPISLCHEKTNDRLIVGVWQSDRIHVYECPE